MFVRLKHVFSKAIANLVNSKYKSIMESKLECVKKLFFASNTINTIEKRKERLLTKSIQPGANSFTACAQVKL